MTQWDASLIAFRTPGFYSDAVYVQNSNPNHPFMVRVVFSSPTEADTTLANTGIVLNIGRFLIRTSDIPVSNPPRGDDVIVVNDIQYIVTSDPMLDDIGLVWDVSAERRHVNEYDTIHDEVFERIG